MKPKVLYHGSPICVQGMIKPCRAVDVKNYHHENNLCAVYATDNSELAISRAIEKGNLKRVDARRANESKYVFLYHLSSQTFERSTIDASQYISFVPVMPLKVESIDVFDYLGLIGPNFWQHIVTHPKSLMDKALWGLPPPLSEADSLSSP